MSSKKNELEEYWKKLGPGLVTGAADNDPSGIVTYSQAGAKFGFGLLWLAPFTFPFMAIVQEMCARIGLVTGQGLAANIKKHFSRKILFLCTVLLFTANTINIGADLGAMGASVRLLAPQISNWIWVIFFAVFILGMEVFIKYERYARYLKYSTFILLAYIFSVFAIDIDWSDVLRSIAFPRIHFSREYIFIVCAILGTTISPYLFFWQASQEIEEEVLKGETSIQARREDAHPRAIKAMRTDVWTGMAFSNIVMFFIMIASAATLFSSGNTSITTAADAAIALKPIAGSWAYVFFAVGIVGTGLLGIPVLAGATSYAIAELFGWKYGLYRPFRQARAFYGVMAVSIIIGLAINFSRIHPVTALLYAAVINGMIAPVILFFILRLSGNRTIMGRYQNHPLIAKLGWFLLVIMAVIGLTVIAQIL